MSTTPRIIRKALGGGRGKKAVQLVIHVAKQGVAYRKKRIQGGQPPIIGAKARRRRMRKGKGVAFYSQREAAAVQSVSRTLPVSAPMQVNSAAIASQIFSKVEPAYTVFAESANNGIIDQDSRLDLVPTNPRMFNAIASTALTYQYYKWRNIHIQYMPNTSYDSAGTICLAVVPSVSAASTIYDYETLASLSSAVTFSAKAKAVYNINPNMLNKTFQVQGYVVTRYADVDNTNQEQIEGSLMMAFTGFTADTDGTQLGELHISYDIELLGPLVQTQQTTTCVDFTGTAADMTAPATTIGPLIQTYLDKWLNPSFTFEEAGDGDSLLVAAAHKQPYVLTVSTVPVSGSSGTVTATCTAAVEGEAVVHTIHGANGQSGATHRTWLIVPRRPGVQVAFKVIGDTANSALYSIHAHHVSVMDRDRLIA